MEGKCQGIYLKRHEGTIKIEGKSVEYIKA